MDMIKCVCVCVWDIRDECYQVALFVPGRPFLPHTFTGAVFA